MDAPLLRRRGHLVRTLSGSGQQPHGPIQLSDGRQIYPGKQFGYGDHRIGVCESSDDGRTWSVPRSIGVWRLLSHLLRLQDNRLVMAYGYRRKPYGNQARVSEDGGRSWSEPITLSSDGFSGDLG